MTRAQVALRALKTIRDWYLKYQAILFLCVIFLGVGEGLILFQVYLYIKAGVLVPVGH
jgi:hypothetical protein